MNAATTRSLNDELVEQHGLTIEQYEILSRLARTGEGRMRQAGLTEQPLRTAANVKRVVAELERRHLVDRSEGQAPVLVLTDEGREKVRAARSSHYAQLEELLGSTSSEVPPQPV